MSRASQNNAMDTQSPKIQATKHQVLSNDFRFTRISLARIMTGLAVLPLTVLLASEPVLAYDNANGFISDDNSSGTRLDGQPLDPLALAGQNPEQVDRSQIQELDLSGKGLTSLDLKGYTSLWYLDISGNNLKGELDLTECPELHFLNCSNNQITKIVKFNEPWGLDCSNNAIPYLDMSPNADCFQGADNLQSILDWTGYSGKTVTNDFSGQKIQLKEAAAVIDLAALFDGINPTRAFLGPDNGKAKMQDGAVISNISKRTVTYRYQPSELTDTEMLEVTLVMPEIPSNDPVLNDPLIPLDPEGDKNSIDGVVSDLQKNSGIAAMQRLYNPNSGEHFYTKDLREHSYLVSIGWRDEGIGWYGPNESAHPVYRLYNKNAGDHHYTLSMNERDELRRLGWKYEGIGWYSDEAKQIPLYRQYNPNAKAGAHNYTASKRENDYLVSVGWKAEGVGWYGIDEASVNQPLYGYIY